MMSCRKSGITKKLLKNVTKTLKDVQMDMMEMLPKNVILIGQSLNCDLQALQVSGSYMFHKTILYIMTLCSDNDI